MSYASPAVLESIGKFSRQAQSQFLTLLQPKLQKVLKKFAGLITELPSDGPSEAYPVMGATPQLKEYSEGNVPGMEINSFEQLLPNRQFGMSVSIGRNFFADIDRMKGARATLMNRIAGGLSTRGANFINKLVADMLLQNAPYDGLLAYDGYALYSASHPGGSNVVTGQAGDYSQPRLRSEHSLALSAFAAMKDPDNSDYLREEAPSKLVYLVDPAHLVDYATLFRSAYAPAPVMTGGGGEVVAAGSVENVLKGPMQAQGIDGLGNEVVVIGWTRLAAGGKSFVFDVSGDVDGTTALIHQVREAPTLEYLGPSETNPVWVIGEKAMWKVRLRGEIGIGDFAKTVRIAK